MVKEPSQVKFKGVLKVKILYCIGLGHSLAFAERFIRTFKDMLFKRAEANEKKEKQHIQWVDYIFEIMIAYNDKIKHSATGMTPQQAKKKEFEFNAKLNVVSRATCRR